MIAEINEPNKMPILAESIKAASPAKAKPAMNMDIVKPTPAKNDTPMMCQVEISDGILMSLILLANKTNEVIPRLFPKTRLTTIAVTRLNSNGAELFMTTPALAKANTGIIK